VNYSQDTNVDIQGMKSAVPHFESAHSGINGKYQMMDEQYTALRANWGTDSEGGSAEFFTALHDWLDNCNTINQQLQIVTEKLKENIVGYERAHSTAGEAGAQVKQQLGVGLPNF